MLTRHSFSVSSPQQRIKHVDNSTTTSADRRIIYLVHEKDRKEQGDATRGDTEGDGLDCAGIARKGVAFGGYQAMQLVKNIGHLVSFFKQQTINRVLRSMTRGVKGWNNTRRSLFMDGRRRRVLVVVAAFAIFIRGGVTTRRPACW